jgi:hypothetical protein
MVGMRRLMTLSAGLFALSILSVSGAVHAQSSAPEPQADDTGRDSATPLAKKLQNPDSDLYSFPFQNNTNFNYGPPTARRTSSMFSLSSQSTSPRTGTSSLGRSCR